MNEWSLVSIGEPFAGARPGLVVPVQGRDGADLVLKILPEAEWAAHEAAALAYWGGRGAVRLIASERGRGALLTERVNPGTGLAELCSSDDRAATHAAASVLAELRGGGTSDGVPLPSLTSWLATLQPEAAAERPAALATASRRAWSIASDLLSDASVGVLHGDLQHFNILKAERAPWLAIDPKGVIGPPEAESAALLRNPRRFVLSHSNPRRLLSDRVAILSERLDYDADVLALWGYVLAVVAAAWAFEDQGTDIEVQRWLRCAYILDSMLARC